MLTLPSIPNINPYTSAQVFKKEVQFFTQDEITGQSITEGYNVNGPSHSSITPIPLAGGTKFVVPITTNTGAGAPYLKFHFPNGTSSNKMYVTFAVKNSRMADGYYDYTTGVPTTYRNQLKNFILLPQANISNVSGPREKAIRFTTYGSSTNKPAEAVTFYVKFTAVFSPTTVSQEEVAVGIAGPAGGTTPSSPFGSIQLTGFPGEVRNP